MQSCLPRFRFSLQGCHRELTCAPGSAPERCGGVEVRGRLHRSSDEPAVSATKAGLPSIASFAFLPACFYGKLSVPLSAVSARTDQMWVTQG